MLIMLMQSSNDNSTVSIRWKSTVFESTGPGLRVHSQASQDFE